MCHITGYIQIRQGIHRRQAGLLLCFILMCLFFTGSSSSAAAAESKVIAEWERTWGGSMQERGLSSSQTLDGGFIVTGEIIIQNTVQRDRSHILLVRFDGGGTEIWRKNLSYSGYDRGTSVLQTGDGGFIVAGTIKNFPRDDRQVCLVKVNSSGQVMWKNSYGNGSDDSGVCVRQTGDGGYIIAADSSSAEEENSQILLIKTNASGKKEWMKLFGSKEDENAACIHLTSNGGFIVAGRTYSTKTGGYDVYLFKVNQGGDLEWERTFGGNGWDMPFSLKQTADGGYIVAGQTYSPDGESDVYLVKTGPLGHPEWERTFGGRELDMGRSVRQNSDGGFMVAGWSKSYEPGKTCFYLVKTNANGERIQEFTLEGDRFDENFYIVETSDGGYILVGCLANALRNNEVRNDGLQLDLVRLRLMPYIVCPVAPQTGCAQESGALND
ncbi:MAG TPA: hypothetical protein DEF36_08480 [Desulfotomaculum sp.]|nr:hypothetical protein [Desulfotomaculum sp.]